MNFRLNEPCKAIVPHIVSLFHALAVGTLGSILVEGSGELERGQQCLKINDKNLLV